MGKHKKYKHDGMILTSRECADYAGLTLDGFHSRLKKFNGDIKKTMEHPFKGNMARKNKTYSYKNKQFSVKELASIKGLTTEAIYKRLQKHKYNTEKAMAYGKYKKQ